MLWLLTDDPRHIAQAYGRLDAARRWLERQDVTYGLLTRNSNTVVGCLLEDAGLIEPARRGSMLLSLRAPGFGARCPG